MKILVTGTAGFIRVFCGVRLAERGDEVVGIETSTKYYDVAAQIREAGRDGLDRASLGAGEWVKSSKYPRTGSRG